MTRFMLFSVLIGWSAASCIAADATAVAVEPERSGHVSVSPQVGNNGHAPAVRYGLSEYRIGPEDVLNISVWNNSAISRTVPVRPDGKISLPLVNDVHASGLTPWRGQENRAA
jgi:polysaccharide export outer membrane protein